MNVVDNIKTRLTLEYANIVEASSRTVGFLGPSQLMRYWNSLIGYFTSRIILEYLGEAQNILLVGDGGGRDYWYLKWHNKKAKVIDIAEQNNIPDEDLIIHDLHRSLPFENGIFDAVVVIEVLEHLIDDAFALREFNRILKPDGVLIASVPFLHDEVEHHVRIHTFPTFKRLLNATGFTIIDSVMRGGLLVLERFKIYFTMKTIANYLTYKLIGKTYYHLINNFLFNLQMRIGRSDNLIVRFAKPPLYGCFVKCIKTDPTDFSGRSKEWFKNYGVRCDRV